VVEGKSLFRKGKEKERKRKREKKET